MIAAAETVGARGLAELAALSRGTPALLLAPVRAAAIAPPRPVLAAAGGAPEDAASAIAFRLPPALLDPAALRSLADPTAERLLGEGAVARPERLSVPLPLAGVALALAKLARLLPAVVAAPAAPEGGPPHHLLSVEAAQVIGYPQTAATTLHRVAEAAVPLEDAPDARIVAFRAGDGGIEHLAILVGRPEDAAREPRAARAPAFGMLHRRPAGLAALRLRAAAARRHCPHGRGRRRRAAVPGAGGPRHRPGEQAARLCPAGFRPGHAGRQPRPGLGRG